MGMFDSVMVPCPKCGKRSEFQSKSGPRNLITVNLEVCPTDILMDVNRHAPNKCSACQTWFEVQLNVDAKVIEVLPPDTTNNS